MKIKFPRYVPYPLAWLRLLVNWIALCGMVIFTETAGQNNVNITHPFFWMLCLLLMGFIGFIAHYPVRAILIKMGGISSTSMIDSLWEGVLLVMVTVNSLLVLSIAVSGLFYESILRNFANSQDFSDWNWQDPSSQTDPTAGSWLLFLFYCVLALYLYHLEYLARQPQTIAAKPSPKKNPPVTPPTKISSPPLTPQQEIQQEIERLKKTQR